MASIKKDWNTEWEAIQKENRKLAKRANQRMVRLERAAEAPGMQSILKYAYKVAQRDLTSLGKEGPKKRFTEHVTIKAFPGPNGKKLTGTALIKANVRRARIEQKMMKEFLSSATSTMGKTKGYEAEGISGTVGVKAVWDKVNQTINTNYLSEYDLEMSDSDFKRFWESRKQKKLEQTVGSDLMFAVASVMKKFNLMANKKDFEKFLKNNMEIPDEADIKGRTGETFEQYLDRVSEFAQYTDDQVLNKAINKALKEGLGVSGVFLS